jgi:tRNA-dihydrouridine synthase
MKNEKNIGLQIFGSKPQEFIDAIKIINKSCKPDYIDINMCCPALMVVRDGAGAGLMRNRGMVEKVVRACKSSTTLPICVKIRSG